MAREEECSGKAPTWGRAGIGMLQIILTWFRAGTGMLYMQIILTWLRVRTGKWQIILTWLGAGTGKSQIIFHIRPRNKNLSASNVKNKK